ncbi:hypothetical protein P170DRAFT_464200 [Aspergillus steynii IBT 23096]|uniref:PHD-type domain-containing protein n=1 Tax=Aspergillus steynii IBT 23096 TaxID=1392250 RepID=A0A2I2GEE7_9EURO|nr:uncharacterized protein P170DRAFT_464200 [Aspergillus steynii IBT 23096]PLB51240.1 hypothetical protein P170DRAFT_464200 [Aspergillus steynii IBT 23096]
MAPNLRSLRSSSHASANQSRPSTPADAPAPTSATPSFSETTRPRKRRRTGLNSHAASDPVEGQELPETELGGTAGEAHVLCDASDWKEPPTRVQQTTWEETTWSGTNKESNSVLRSMRPLGEMPSIPELRKQGFLPKITDPNDPYDSNTGEMPPAVDGANDLNEDTTGNLDVPTTVADETEAENLHEAEPQTVSESQTETAPEPATAQPQSHILTFMAIPISPSTIVDVEKVRDAVGDALNVASESDNTRVARGLLRMWEKSQSDPFMLSILEAMCKEEPDPTQRRAFNIMMRAVGKELRAEDAELEAAALSRKRKHSQSSDSSLSSAKSLDVETFAPGMAATRAKGRHAKAANTAQVAGPPIRHSAFPPRNAPLKRKRAMEQSEDFTPEAMTTKRIRLRPPVPESVTPAESQVRPVPDRTSLPPIPDSDALSTSRQATPVGKADAPRARPESPSSSDAEGNRRLTPTLSRGDDRADNNDFCRECRGSGQLLCCDGCVNSFHFSCLSPPLDPANPPEGDWYCPRCTAANGMDSLLSSFKATTQTDFALPQELREYFAGVRTDDAGSYQEGVPIPRFKPRTVKGSREARYDDPFLLRVKDAKGRYIFCIICGRSTGGERPIIHCDYCECGFHLDCLDPPLANPPMQKPGNGDRAHGTWMCPNHVLHDLMAASPRIRRPRNARRIDVEVVPNEEEMEELEEQNPEGVLLHVKEDGIKLDFIKRVKQDNAEREAITLAAATHAEYAARRFDALTAGAQAFFDSNPPAVPTPEVTASTPEATVGWESPLRTTAEREAAANLIEFAQSNPMGVRPPEAPRIGLLIDALRASAPEFPSVESEVEALRSLQSLIERRIEALNQGTPR